MQPAAAVRPPSMPVSLCAHAAVTFSGIIKASALLIEIPGKIMHGPWKSVSSVQCVSAAGLRKKLRVPVWLACSQRLKDLHLV